MSKVIAWEIKCLVKTLLKTRNTEEVGIWGEDNEFEMPERYPGKIFHYVFEDRGLELGIEIKVIDTDLGKDVDVATSTDTDIT